MSGQLHTPAALPSGERVPGIIGTTVGLDDVDKGKFLILPGLEFRPLSHPASIQSFYRLRYPGSFLEVRLTQNMVDCGRNADYV
jgi:hypothetical protein